MLLLLLFLMLVEVQMDTFYFAVGTINGSIDMYNSTDKVKSLCQLNKSFFSLESVGNDLLAAGTDDGTIIIWNYLNQETVLSVKHSTERITSLLAIEKTYLVSGSRDGSIKIWNLFNFSIVKTILNAHGNGPIILKLLPNSKNEFSSFGKGEFFKKWTTKDNFSMLKTKISCQNYKDLEYLESDAIVLGCESNIRSYFTNGTLRFIKNLDSKTSSLRKVNSSFLLVGLQIGKILFFDLIIEEITGKLDAHTISIQSIDIINEILITTDDNSIKLWNIGSLNLFRSFRIENPRCLKFLENLSFVLNKSKNETCKNNQDFNEIRSISSTRLESKEMLKNMLKMNSNVYLARLISTLNESGFIDFSKLIFNNDISLLKEIMKLNLDINNCLVNCSSNGRCKFVEEKNKFMCECFESFYGPFCNKKNQACDSNPCLNNGTCISRLNGFRCECYKEFYFGKYCEKEIDLCEREACSKNGVCIVNENREIFCKCFDLYYGEKCQIESQDLLVNKYIKKTSQILAIVFLVLIFFLALLSDLLSIYLKKSRKKTSKNKSKN